MDKKMGEKQEIRYDYSKLLGRIKEIYRTQAAFAEELGIGRVSVSQRLNNKLEFTQNEIAVSCRLLKIPKAEMYLYFFKEIES